jgi:cyclase
MPDPGRPTGWRYARAIPAATMLLAVPLTHLAGQASDATARMQRVADSTYVIIHDDATDEWPHGNTGVIVTAEGVFVVDADYLPSRARADIALIRSVTDRPVRYLAYTHWHFDHNNGGSAYQDAFPGVTIVSERETRDWIALNSRYWATLSTAPNSARRQALAVVEREASTGRDSSGRKLGQAERAKRSRAAQQRTAELAELASLRVVPPNLAFEGSLTLWLGGRRIELRDRGKANSPHDVTVYLPRDSVLFTGDIVVQSPLPYVGASWPVPWIAVLRQLEAEPVRLIVPGHGPVMRDWSYPRKVRSLLEAATSQAEAMALRGRPLAEVQDSITLDELRAATPVWQGAPLDADWRETVRILVERAWRGVRGQG